ncbi:MULTISPECIES: conserved virulence factor C family protein [Bacillaceae]|uniref:conserved virulence factor C family protein n=1 Tax=Bacillaceae TaxID=186817 RepID=UPI001C57EBE7|nr:conserved virulence factor C family protein [Rossellomorea sp. YZS02]MBW3113232.1 conserved virulence factor C family protein [Bacillus sp. MCCB 382]MDX8343833.1 conserved virulence factor C family protein [Rossellomorea sp. YZS02]
MKILSIEPTPSPNTMKVLLDQELKAGKSNNYKKDEAEGAPPVIKDILSIDGIKGVYHVADFLAVERNAKFDWQELLPKVRVAFGEDAGKQENESPMEEHFGEVNVSVQMFKGVPMQVKVTDGEQEKRFSLPAPFLEAIKDVQKEGDNVVLLRKWMDYGIRYGDLDEIGHNVTEELVAAYPSERLAALVSEAQETTDSKGPIIYKRKQKVSVSDFTAPDWQTRYQKLDSMEDPTLADLPLLEKALEDEKVSIRRLAVVYLGMIEDVKVLPLLYKGLHDKSVTVRRTAGDCLSDLGFPDAIPEMIQALKDKSKLVRWRAAMFLYEVGDESALTGLKEAENDPEFEVKLQVKMAIERIEGGEEAKGSVWKQMTEARNQ